MPRNMGGRKQNGDFRCPLENRRPTELNPVQVQATPLPKLRPWPIDGTDMRRERGRRRVTATLSPNKTVVQLFSDYMEYLHERAKSYIKETHGVGPVVYS
jgi:hypothetical protein